MLRVQLIISRWVSKFLWCSVPHVFCAMLKFWLRMDSDVHRRTPNASVWNSTGEGDWINSRIFRYRLKTAVMAAFFADGSTLLKDEEQQRMFGLILFSTRGWKMLLCLSYIRMNPSLNVSSTLYFVDLKSRDLLIELPQLAVSVGRTLVLIFIIIILLIAKFTAGLGSDCASTDRFINGLQSIGS